MKLLVVLALCLFISLDCYAAEPVPNVHSLTYESSHVLTTDPTKSLYWITVTWQTQNQRWLIIYDSLTVPPDGALTPSKVLYCGIVSLTGDPPQGTKSFDFTQHPLYRPTTGLVAIISTNANGCATKTADGLNNWITAGVN